MNQIRTWVRQGRTDAWIAHQLEVPVQQVDAFKREHELLPDGADTAGDAGLDVDLRAADDALIAAEMEAEEAARAEAEEAARVEAEAAAKAAEEARAAAGDEEDDEEGEAPRRRRGRRGGRGRSRRGGPTELEGTFEHGEEGYGLWLDPAVADSPVYAEHWAGHRGVTVLVEEDQIIIRRAGDDEPDGD